jgi:transposase-like protein
MGVAMKVSDEERARIEATLRDGASINATARRHGRAPATVASIGRAAGIDVAYSAPKKANAARRDYALAERLALLNAGMDKAARLLATVTTPHELQQWMMAVAIGIDKRRLEDGEATSRTDVRDDSAKREELAARLDELAARRAARAG